MADGADRRTRAFEKLGSMTTDAVGMIGIVSDVGELRPTLAWNGVTSLAFRLMLFCCVRKLRIVDSLPEGDTDERDQDY